MSDTYCGKTCESCEERQKLQCPGCRMGPGRTYMGGECTIAKCCVSRNLHTCEDCTQATTCFNRRSSRDAAGNRLRKRIDEETKLRQMLERSKLMGSWLSVLFWLVIVSTVSKIILNDRVLESAPMLTLPAAIFGLVFSVSYALILLKLSLVSYSYRIAGVSGLVYAGMSLLTSLLGSSGWSVFLSFVAIIPAFIMEFQEYMGHAESVQEFDSGLANKWRTLWYWYLGCLCATVLGTLLTMIGMLLAVFVTFVAAIGAAVISIIRIVFLYSTAKVFREYAEYA